MRLRTVSTAVTDAVNQSRIMTKLGLILLPRKSLFSSRHSRQTRTEKIIVHFVNLFH